MSLFHLRNTEFSTDPEALTRMIAARRVQRGIRWLDGHAPKKWWNNLFRIYPDGWIFLPHDLHTNESVLALAFCDAKGVRSGGEYGEVTTWSVAAAYGLSTRFLRTHGFDAATIGALARQSAEITSELLDVAWKEGVFAAMPGRSSRHAYPYRPKGIRPLQHSLKIQPSVKVETSDRARHRGGFMRIFDPIIDALTQLHFNPQTNGEGNKR